MSTKLIIIGGVAGGATAAARARRIDEKATILLYERGEYISFANCGLPYYIGRVIRDREELFLTTPKDFGDRYNIDVRTGFEIIAINPQEKTVTARKFGGTEIHSETYDKLILSPGAEPARPQLPGIESDNIFTLRNIPDTDRIMARIDQDRPRSALVVGGGFIGLEMAENLVHREIRVTVVEMLDQVMAPLDFEMAAIVRSKLEEEGITCLLSTGVQSFRKEEGQIATTTSDGKTLFSDIVILSIGVRPENKLARETGLKIGSLGGIQVNSAMQTSDPNIYAVGDAVEVTDFISGRPTLTALAGPANKQGRIAAENALGRRSVFKGTIGTGIVKIFDLSVAATGLNEKKLSNLHMPYLASYTHSGSHASYYPGAGFMAIKLLFHAGDGKILGAQIVGDKGVDKRIDVLATAIRGSMTVYDLEELELAYAPPYSSAKDPVNMAGFVAANILKGDVEAIMWQDLHDLNPTDDVLIDMREKEELEESGTIEGAVHIPLDDLRAALPSLDKSKRYITFCAVGMRAYLGYRIMVQNGFKVRLFSGGYETYLGRRR